MKIKVDNYNVAYTEISSRLIGKLTKKKTIKVIFCNCSDCPTPQQIKVAEMLTEEIDTYYRPLIEESISYWNKTIKADPIWHEDAQPLSSEADVLKVLKIHVIYIHNNISDDNLRIGFGGSWELDDEHGYGALFQDYQLIDIGHEDVASSDSSDSLENESSIKFEIKALKGFLDHCDETLRAIETKGFMEKFLKICPSATGVDLKKSLTEDRDEYLLRIDELKRKLLQFRSKK
jgi:hypothetical protein